MPKNPHIRNMTHHFEQLFDLVMLLNSSNIAESDDPTAVDAVRIHLQSIMARSSSGVYALGSLLGMIEQEQLQDHLLQDIGWLLAMLGELIHSSQALQHECEQALALIDQPDETQ